MCRDMQLSPLFRTRLTMGIFFSLLGFFCFQTTLYVVRICLMLLIKEGRYIEDASGLQFRSLLETAVLKNEKVLAADSESTLEAILQVCC